jgi:hypothetical protein
MADPQYTEIWNAAVERYKKDAETAFNLTQVDSREAVLKLIQDQQSEFTEFRKRSEAIGTVVKPVLELVEQFADAPGEGAVVVSKMNPDRACML